LNTEAQAAIDASQAWTRRDPKNAEAWFYLAGSYAPLVEWRILRGQRLAAARDGNRIRAALERALAIDPTLSDAYFGIGIYHYYAAVAPAAAKFLRWLLLLPGGNREQGLREIREARDHGLLLSGEADFQLQRIDRWYEHRPEEALSLLEDLDARYPTNPLFLERVADVRATDLHDAQGSRQAWQTLLDRARAGRVYDAARVEKEATRALAR
jgi:tetratricopeptide (TPR) repeat protein